MEIYLFKSVACLGILFLFYKLLLENTSLHTTKRIYLLSILGLSLLIPLITFTEYVVVTPTDTSTIEAIPTIATGASVAPAPVQYMPYIIGAIYMLGVLFFSLRFGINLFRMYERTRYNQKLKNQSIFHVLLQLPILPHSFFNFIFFNKTAYEAGAIPQEVIIHETAHVTQKHSWDILCIEVLHIVFWFNPLLYFIKKSIKLNHEFLADCTVLKQGAALSQYQSILLDFSSTSSVPPMAHAINYSSIKKRFTVMKTNTSKRAAWLKGLLVLPLLAVLIYGFSDTKTIEKSSDATPTARSIDIKINLDGSYMVEGVRTDKNNLTKTVSKLHQDLTPSIRNNMMNIHITNPKNPSREEVQFIYDALLNYGFYRLVAGNQEVVRGKGNTPLASVPVQQINEKELLIMVQRSEITINGMASSLKSFARDIDQLTKTWEDSDYTNTLPNIKIASTPKEFLNKLDAEYKKTKFSKLNGGIGLIPPPPPPPPAPDAPKVLKGVNDTDLNVPPPPPVPSTPKVKSKGVLTVSAEAPSRSAQVPPPPPPPPPSDPLDLMIEVAKKNGTFYYEGNKITSDKAIELVKKNKDLNIQVHKKDTQNPVVKISTKPIYLKKT